MTYPSNGDASTYSDFFVGKKTSNGDIYTHADYTAALLPKSRWHSLPMGTRLQITYKKRSVVVKVNDRGAGKIVNGVADLHRVLDLSRAAMAYLMSTTTDAITDSNAGILFLENIVEVPVTTPLGPVK